MRTLTLLFCSLLLVALALPVFAAKQGRNPAAAARKAGGHKAAATKNPLANYATAITRGCTPTDDQQKAISEKLQTAETDLQAYDAKNKDTKATLTASLKDARQAKDKAKIKDLTDQIKQIDDGRAVIITQFKKDVQALLTPDQQQAWASYQLLQEVEQYFAKAKLTDDQIAKIKPLCDDAVKAIAALKDTNITDKAKIKHDLLAKINNDILTDDQRAEMLPPMTTGDKTTNAKTPKTKTPKNK